MNDRQYRDQKARVSKYVHKWRDILGLWKDRINIVYERRHHSDRSHTNAECWASWQYRNHRVVFYLPEIAEIKDESEVEETVVHELTHILMHPATGDSTNKSSIEVEVMEYAVQTVAYSIIWAYNQGKKDATKV